MRTGIIFFVFLSYFAVCPVFAGITVQDICNYYYYDANVCNQAAGCYYVQVEGESARCAQAPAGYYTTGDGVLRDCINGPKNLQQDDYLKGNNSADCYWQSSIPKGKIYRAKKRNTSQPSDSPMFFYEEDCPAGMVASGAGNYTVKYNGSEGLLGLDDSCRACTEDDDNCNFWIVFRNNKFTGTYITRGQLQNFYDESDKRTETTNVYGDGFVYNEMVADDGGGYDVTCSSAVGKEFGLQCGFFKYEERDDEKGGKTYYSRVSEVHFDTWEETQQGHSQIVADIEEDTEGISLVLCAPACTKLCTEGYYCDGTKYKTQCPNGLTTKTTGAQSVDKCGVKAGVTVFKDSKGTFKLPGTWFAYPAK